MLGKHIGGLCNGVQASVLITCFPLSNSVTYSSYLMFQSCKSIFCPNFLPLIPVPFISAFSTQPNIISVMSALHLPDSYLLPPKVHQARCAHWNYNSVFFYSSDSPTSLGATWGGSTAFLDWEFNNMFSLFLVLPWISIILLLHQSTSLHTWLYHLFF